MVFSIIEIEVAQLVSGKMGENKECSTKKIQQESYHKSSGEWEKE